MENQGQTLQAEGNLFQIQKGIKWFISNEILSTEMRLRSTQRPMVKNSKYRTY